MLLSRFTVAKITNKDVMDDVIIPKINARGRFTRPQFFFLLSLSSLVFFYILAQTQFYNFYFRFNPFGNHKHLLEYSLSVIYLSVVSHKLYLIVHGVLMKNESFHPDYSGLNPATWPKYSILLPVYREENVFKHLVDAINGLDYPPDKLDILLLLEEDDEQMRDCVARNPPPNNWKTIIIPQGYPKTKGRALNYGLKAAEGEYLVIYDAEDIPEKDQLKKAAALFSKQPQGVVCLQSKLNYYSPDYNLLTKWCTIEYSSWFDTYLPGIESVRAPVPLGGTSNHFKTEKLRSVGGWDPYNVTEDCDLGIRLSRAGYRTRILDSTTWEEPNSRLSNWLNQRSRWLKGYIQTYFVHMRDPLTLMKDLGVKNFIHFNFIVGGNFLVLLLNPLAWFFLFRWVHSTESLFNESPVILLVTYTLLFCNLAFIFINTLGALKRRYYRLMIPALLSPLYWMLMSLGVAKGLAQFFRKPHYWEKTAHGFVQK